MHTIILNDNEQRLAKFLAGFPATPLLEKSGQKTFYMKVI